MKLLPVTALSTWKRCPVQFYKAYVLEEKEPVNAAMALGLLKHKLHELINKNEQTIITALRPEKIEEQITVSFTPLLRTALLTYTATLRSLSIPITEAHDKAMIVLNFEAKDLAERVQPFIAKGLTGDGLWEQLTPKIKPEYKVESNNLKLKGRIDKLECHGTTLIPVELKSGRLPAEGVFEEHKIQAGSYAMLIEDIFGNPVSHAIVHYIDHNQRRPVHMNPFLKDSILDIRDKAFACLDSQEEPKGCGQCNTCQIRQKPVTKNSQKTLNTPQNSDNSSTERV